jgi:hypothetical protein
MNDEEERSRETRARAETALVRLLHELRDDEPLLVVLGGLVPDVLARDATGTTPEHLGTTDVDVLLITHVEPDLNLNAVEQALERLDFSPDPSQNGWRWRGLIDGVPVRIEFLCDLADYREGESIRPPGCRKLSAANLRGTGYVARDFAWEQLHGRLADGTPVEIRARFAGLEGYLLSKCVAVRTRAAIKDYYDLAYVLQHNRAGGPEQAARKLHDGNLQDALATLRSTFLEVRERYRKPSDVGPHAYAEQAVQVDPAADEAELRADAVDVVHRFFDALDP